MANPRQRRKQRSSSHRAVSHSRHAKRNLKKTPPIRGPKALQDAWDKTKTVRQNYAQLGLVVTLDPLASGGIEKPLGRESASMDTTHDYEPVASTSTAPTSQPNVPVGFGRIKRDADGTILGFELNESVQEEATPKTRDLEEELESRMDQDVRQKWSTHFSSQIGQRDENLIKSLEEISGRATGTTTLSIPISGAGHRHASSGELKYLQPLIAKYGDKVESMANDLKLNPEQRTAGQLRRALRKLQ
ncbi:Nucleolar protein 16 [Psilocybe cubensis]|uniref:Nucleolar protein 16 n=2 Tax=Psilocybe cubensis TaxID=181762 RepID=A0ACB8H925_PSICU|nr:Nucleolar protein 16 [Psilocybe cubensis]KAH9484157.1 Nucleolar protein 16 [Psilocybe cubensis]